MLEIDEKAMAYCLVEALFAAGVINLPTYQNFLRMKRACKGFVNNRERLWWRILPEPFFLSEKARKWR